MLTCGASCPESELRWQVGSPEEDRPNLISSSSILIITRRVVS